MVCVCVCVCVTAASIREFRGPATDYSILENIITGSEGPLGLVFSGTAPPPSTKGIKRPGCEFGHSPLSKAGFKNECRYTSARPVCLGQLFSTFFCTMDPYESLVKPVDPFPPSKKYLNAYNEDSESRKCVIPVVCVKLG